MERIPKGIYTPEFRAEAVKLVEREGLSVDAAAKRLELPAEKVIVDIGKYGNMSAASIPVALAEAVQAHRFKKGDLIALAGFGAGLTWASCIMKWAKEDELDV